MKTVIVGMSGGVDSSVSAYLLQKKGYRVIGVFMRNWHEEDGPCPAEADYQDALSVCEHLSIPCYTVDFSKQYWDRVFQRCVEDFEKGLTPNPDIWCNQEIKFRLFFEKALSMGADYLATGHYCRISENNHLLRGVDLSKDQSYFLCAIDGNCLSKVLFPIGELPKSEVRKIAESAGLITANKKDSTGICFIGKRPFQEFLSRYIQPKPGVFIDPEGTVVGNHKGAAYYTIGQRRGLNIGGAGQGWYVVGKDMQSNTVTVVQGDDHPLLYRSTMHVHTPKWLGEKPGRNFHCTVKVRYRTPDVPCFVTQEENGSLCVAFKEPQRAITPQQSAVFYQGDRCLGGGLIASFKPGL